MTETVRAPLAIVLPLVLAVGCSADDFDSGKPGSSMAAPAPPAFVPDTFEQLYPMFLQHKLSVTNKAALWQRYRGKWVHWTGTLVSFNANGITLKQLPQTATFDVSLYLAGARLAAERTRLKPGDRVTYVGRLDSYDDIFRTLYLTLGSVVPTAPTASVVPTPSRGGSSARP